MQLRSFVTDTMIEEYAHELEKILRTEKVKNEHIAALKCFYHQILVDKLTFIANIKKFKKIPFPEVMKKMRTITDSFNEKIQAFFSSETQKHHAEEKVDKLHLNKYVYMKLLDKIAHVYEQEVEEVEIKNLKEEDIVTFSKEVATILAEEKIALENHPKIIVAYVKQFQLRISTLNELTENYEKVAFLTALLMNSRHAFDKSLIPLYGSEDLAIKVARKIQHLDLSFDIDSKSILKITATGLNLIAFAKGEAGAYLGNLATAKAKLKSNEWLMDSLLNSGFFSSSVPESKNQKTESTSTVIVKPIK